MRSSPRHRSSSSAHARLAGALIAASALAVACGSDSGTSADLTTTIGTAAQATTIPTTAATPSTTTTTDAAVAVDATGDLSAGFAMATWSDDITITIENGTLHYISNGIPNHDRDAEYAVPTAGVMVPDASSAVATADPTTAQTDDYTISLTPTMADTPTSTSLGVIGVMISGASLFNPYEGDGATVAAQSNFSVKNAAGDDVWFLDDCGGHPTPMGQYHYHKLPVCVTATIDEADGASHILGIAFDGFPIYGDRDIDGNQLTAADLDECNGITSPTPEFPEGVYHYVLLDVADSTSSIRCFSGEVDESLMSSAMPGMGGGAGGMPGGPPPTT